jgi:predicted 2-oxoglutarate/Fe(II)-dependent dioxygenase YbiX
MNSNQQISDYIFFYPDVMDKKTCEWIINRYDTTAEWRQSTFSTAYKNTGTSQVAMDEYWIKSEAPYHKDLKKSFEYCVNDYISVHDKIKIQEYTNYRINRYGKGGFMQSHIDNIHHSHGQKQGYPHITSLIFLNDDYEGGEFVICGDKHIEKIQGSAIVFPSNFMYPHEVKEVTEGKRFSVMTWIL